MATAMSPAIENRPFPVFAHFFFEAYSVFEVSAENSKGTITEVIVFVVQKY